MIFKTHPSNIPQIRAVIAQFGGCYVHGDGNMYALDNNGNSEESNFRVDFSNDTNEVSRYRVKFQRGEQVPRTVEELNARIMAAKNQEILTRQTIRETSKVKTIEVLDEDYQDADAEVDYSKYDQRNKNK